MDLFTSLLLSVLILCFALILFILWLGQPGRHSDEEATDLPIGVQGRRRMRFSHRVRN